MLLLLVNQISRSFSTPSKNCTLSVLSSLVAAIPRRHKIFYSQLRYTWKQTKISFLLEFVFRSKNVRQTNSLVELCFTTENKWSSNHIGGGLSLSLSRLRAQHSNFYLSLTRLSVSVSDAWSVVPPITDYLWRMRILSDTI